MRSETKYVFKSPALCTRAKAGGADALFGFGCLVREYVAMSLFGRLPNILLRVFLILLWCGNWLLIFGIVGSMMSTVCIAVCWNCTCTYVQGLGGSVFIFLGWPHFRIRHPCPSGRCASTWPAKQSEFELRVVMRLPFWLVWIR